MKRIFILFIILSGLTNCSPKLIISELKDYKSIEKVKIGMPINTAIGLAKKNHFIEKREMPGYEGEDKEYEYVVYADNSKKVALFSFNSGYDNQTKNKVYRIVIKNPKYRTPEGVFTGMQLKRLKETAKLKSIDFNYDDGLILISETFDGGFLMDISTLKDSNYNFANPKISTLPADLKIKEIILF
jgi:hypothetical protein